MERDGRDAFDIGSAGGHRRVRRVCVCAWLFAVPNLYWGLGGTFGVATIGEEAAALSWRTDPFTMAVVLAAGLVKIVAGFFALALVRPWGRIVPRRVKLVVGWGGAVVLTLYGAVQLSSQALVAAGVIQVDEDVDLWALYWHLFLWSPWFLLWGVLLGLAIRHHQRASGGASTA